MGLKIKRKKFALSIFPAFLILSLGTGSSFAVEEGSEAVKIEDKERPAVSADVGLFSQYIWRGWAFSKDSIVIQPSATVGYKGLSFNLWGNFDTDQYDIGRAKWNETDITLSYDRTLGPVELGAGYIYYAATEYKDTQEFYLSAKATTILSPTFTIYRDITSRSTWYLNMKISHSFLLPKEMTLDLAASAGYYISNSDKMVKANNQLEDTDEKYRGFHDGVISASLNLPLAKHFTLTPMIAYSFPLSKEADNRLKADNEKIFGNKADLLFGGITLSMDF